MALDTVMDITIAGGVIYNKIHNRPGCQKGKRGERKQPSTQKKKEYNNRIMARRVSILLDENFGPGDGSSTLTYQEDPGSMEEAKKDFANFVRRMKYRFHKEGKELKYLGSIERGEETGRIHIHVVLNTKDEDLVREVWGKGNTHTDGLHEDDTYKSLAEYIVKKKRKSFEEPEKYERKEHAYMRSRNLRMPVTKQLEVSPKKLDEEPQPVKGYYVPKDSIRDYYNPLTGVKSREFIQLPLREPWRFRAYPAGKKVKGESLFWIPHEMEPVQIDFMEAIAEWEMRQKK